MGAASGDSSGGGEPAAPPPGSASPPAPAAVVPALELPDPLAEPGGAGVREDQVANAVAFLSHPKVRSSGESAKRSFLEKKGLTAAEIDEAFRRVPPEPASAAATTSATPSVGANNLVTYTRPAAAPGAVAAPPAHAGPPAAAAPPPPALGPGAGALVPAGQLQLAPRPQPLVQQLSWGQAVLGAGVAAASLYGLHQLLVPRLSAWSSRLLASRRAAAEEEAARAAALADVLERLAAGQGRLQDTLESLTAALQQQQAQAQAQAQPSRQQNGGGGAPDEQQQYACAYRGAAQQQQQQQPDSMYSTARGGSSSSRAAAIRGPPWEAYDASTPTGSYTASYRPGSGYNGPSSTGGPGSVGRSPRGAAGSAAFGSSMEGASFEVTPPSHGLHQPPQLPAQYRALQPASQQQQQQQQRDEQGAGDAGYARRNAGAGYAGPELSPAMSSSGRPGPGQQQGNGGGDDAPRSAAFHEVMEMVRAGITPPNVRTDIKDSPPDPSRPISAPQMPPRGKPWERGGADAAAADGGDSFAAPASGSAPWAANGAGSEAAGWPSGRPGSAGGREDGSSSAAKPAAYDLSHLLGPDAGRDAPWRPPPPPASSLPTPRPGSSGSSSGKAAPAVAMADAPQQQPAADAATPAPAPAAAGAADAEAVVAGVAASAVRNVVAAAAAAADAAPAAVGPQHEAAAAAPA